MNDPDIQVRGNDDRSITPFTIRIEDDQLVDLRGRLQRTRLPDQIPGSGWDLGTDRDELQALCDYWLNGYDWRRAEQDLNRSAQFRTTIDGQQLHFIHERSERADAVPILLLHGWPGSVVEFRQVIGPLVNPTLPDGSPDVATHAFHVVAPSLPGFAWSGPTHERGWDVGRMARAVDELMQRLGYQQYFTQGGDAGAIIATQLGLLVPEHLLAIHLNLIVVGPPDPGNPLEGLSAADIDLVTASQQWAMTESGYSWIQGTRPQTLAYGLNDSPAGLAAWIIEKYRGWSDCNGDLWSRFTRDDILTNIMLYWLTGTIGSSARLYVETRASGAVTAFRQRVECPTAVAVFPKEHNRFPRRWAEARYDIRRWTEMPSGGHFAAMEEPELLIADVRRFVSDILD